MLIKKISTPTEIKRTSILDTLNSSSVEDALSANQGKILNEKIMENKYCGFGTVTSSININQGVFTDITFNEISERNPKFVEINTNGFTIKATGTYRITYSVRFNDNANVGQGAGISVNGEHTDILGWTWSTNNSRLVINSSVINDFESNDFISPMVYSDMNARVTSLVYHIEKI